MPLAWAGAGLPLGLFLGASFDASPLALLLLAAATVGAYILARAAGVGVAGPALLSLVLLAGMARAGPDTLSVGGGLERVHGQRVELLGSRQRLAGARGPAGAVRSPRERCQRRWTIAGFHWRRPRQGQPRD